MLLVDVDVRQLHAMLAGVTGGSQSDLDAAATTRPTERRQNREHGHWRVAVTMLAVVLVGLAGTLGTAALVNPAGTKSVSAPTPVAQWPARGNLVGAAGLLDEATRVIAAHGADWGGRYVVDRFLYAGRSSNAPVADFKATVVIALVHGTDATQAVAFLTTAAQDSGSSASIPVDAPLLLRSIAPIDPDEVAGSIGFVVPRTSADAPAGPSALDSTLLVTLMDPRAAAVELSSSLLDPPMSDGGAQAKPAVVDGLSAMELPEGVGIWNTSLAADGSTDPVVLGGPPGAAPATASVTATVDDGSIIGIQSTTRNLEIGDPVAIPAGLVGVVTDIEGNRATVTTDLRELTSTRWHIIGFGTDNRGTIAGVPGDYEFLPEDTRTSVHRIALVDGSGTIVINVGETVADPGKSDGARHVLDRSVNPADLRPGTQVYVGRLLPPS